METNPWTHVYEAALDGLVEVLRAGHESCLDACLQSQDIPRDIGPEVFATDGASSGALNEGAVLGRNLAVRVLPLVDSAFRDPEKVRQGALGTDDFGGLVDHMHTSSLSRNS
jgi:hypothetical protein